MASVRYYGFDNRDRTRRTVEELHEELGQRLIPKGVLSVSYRLEDAGQDGAVAMVNCDTAYHYLTITLFSSFFCTEEKFQRWHYVHEIVHHYVHGVSGFARNELCRACEDENYRDSAVGQLVDRTESCVQQISHLILELIDGVPHHGLDHIGEIVADHGDRSGSGSVDSNSGVQSPVG